MRGWDTGLLLLFLGVTIQTNAIPSLNLQPVDGLTISGISSGGAFAVQFHTAFSSMVHAAAIFAGKPYHCEQQDPGLRPEPSGYPGDWCNQNPSVVSAMIPALINYTWAVSAAGLIDPVQGIRADPIYLYIGQKDHGHAGEMKHTRAWYSPFVGVDAIQSSIDEVPSSHCIPTIQSVYPAGYQARHPPKACGEDGLPFLQLCGYDGAGNALQHLYNRNLTKRSALPYVAPKDHLVPFDQTPFFNQSQPQTLSSTGYLFIPPECRSSAIEAGPACKLHVNLHGCTMSADNVGLDYILAAGFNEWAVVNRIVVLYPQVLGSNCWDNYGDTGQDYCLRSGVEMATVERIVQAVLRGNVHLN